MHSYLNHIIEEQNIVLNYSIHDLEFLYNTVIAIRLCISFSSIFIILFSLITTVFSWFMYILSPYFYSLVLYEEQTWDQTTNFSIEIYSYAYEAIHLSTCFESLSKSSSIHKHTILALCSSYSMNSTIRLNTLLSLLQFDCLYYLSIIYPVLPSISSIQPSEISSSLLQQSLYQLLHCYWAASCLNGSASQCLHSQCTSLKLLSLWHE